MTIKTRVAIGLTAVLLAPVIVRAQAFRNLDNSASATAQGAAVAAQADDPAAIQYNPAGITQLPGLQLSIGTNLMSARVTFTGLDSSKVHGGNPGSLVSPPPSNFYLTMRLGTFGRDRLRNVTAGFGISAPFGLQVSYPTTGPLSTVSTYATLPLLNLKPALAVQLDDHVSLGAGVDIYTFTGLIGGGEARLKLMAGPEFGPLGIPAGAPLEANGHDSALGFNLSGLITPVRYASGAPRINAAVIYRSPATLHLKGDFLINGQRAAGAELPVALPRIVTGAIAVWPLRDDRREWKIEIDADHVDWSSFENSNLTLSNGVTLPFPRSWQTANVLMFGTEYGWLHPHALRGWDVVARPGYIRSTTPIPESTFDPVVPDAAYNAFSFGLGLVCRARGAFLGALPCGDGREGRWTPKALRLDFAYQFVAHDSRQITRNLDPRVNGRWDGSLHIAAVNIGMRF